MQLINVAKGGSLHQDLSERDGEHILHEQRQERDSLIHKVKLEKGSGLSSILKVQEVFTNTMHHQSVKEVGQGLMINAYTSDGVIEGLESKDGQFMLVQWHPEGMNKLFCDLIERAREFKKAQNRI